MAAMGASLGMMVLAVECVDVGRQLRVGLGRLKLLLRGEVLVFTKQQHGKRHAHGG